VPDVTATRSVSDVELEAAMRPRDDLVLERVVAAGRFELADGPFDRWQRTAEVVETRTTADGSTVHTLAEQVHYELAIPVWKILFNPIVRRSIKRGARVDSPSRSDRPPWWATPDRLDARAARGLSLLCILALFAGYMGTLLTQTNTFFKEDFGVSDSAIGTMIAVVRIGALLAMVVVAIADRRGRRTVLIAASLLGCVLTAAGALAPDLATLTVAQTLARSFTAAMALLVAVVAAEEMPAGSRAYAVSVLTMTAALGAGLAVMLLWVGGVAPWGWRILFALPLLAIGSVVRIGRALPETRRFEASDRRATRGEHVSVAPHRPRPRANTGRLVLLAASALCLDVFVTPASSFLNEFLRTDRGFAPWQISVFTILTNTPGGIGIVVGGRLADARGRRVVGAIGLGTGVAFTVLMYLVGNWTIWLWSVLGAVIGAMAVPALAVYGPELFPTDARGRANGVINVARAAGAAAGAFLAGFLADRLVGGLPHAMALLAIGPAIVVGLVLFLYPETAARELEDLNPEDAPLARDLLALEGLDPDLVPDRYAASDSEVARRRTDPGAE
jgi:MFS family permease